MYRKRKIESKFDTHSKSNEAFFHRYATIKNNSFVRSAFFLCVKAQRGQSSAMKTGITSSVGKCLSPLESCTCQINAQPGRKSLNLLLLTDYFANSSLAPTFNEGVRYDKEYRPNLILAAAHTRFGSVD